MYISEVSISNIRAIKFNKKKLFPHINIIYGKNGTGKTTILEGIYLLCSGKSFKTNNIENLTNKFLGEAGAKIKTNTGTEILIKIKEKKKQ